MWNKNEAARNKIMDFQAKTFLYIVIFYQVVMFLKFWKFLMLS